MTESQDRSTSRGSSRKWIAIAGGGCTRLACLVLVGALAIRILMPNIAGMVSQLIPAANGDPGGTQSPTATSKFPQPSGNAIGDPNAPVVVIEYADFQCPYCLRYWQETEPQVIDTYVRTGKVYYQYRSVGAFIGPESAAAAEAAYCAGEQNRFWEYRDELYSHWTGENAGDFTQGKLLQYATAVELDPTAFYECVDGSQYAARVQQDVKDAQADGVHATPSFVINGTLLEGALPFSAFQETIGAALQGK